ncbi:MAG TPA: ribbon-helix-helix protein, CopG family [Opitutaceae bacterium]|jgi:post-segregation antitoxin (ccd killing protein)|nr:ribbon-helix-helix protein, CopG family [Opitutaceae bacterium]
MAPSPRQISVTLPAELWAQLSARARAAGLTVDDLIRAAVQADLRAARRRPPRRPR